MSLRVNEPLDEPVSSLDGDDTDSRAGLLVGMTMLHLEGSMAAPSVCQLPLLTSGHHLRWERGTSTKGLWDLDNLH